MKRRLFIGISIPSVLHGSLNKYVEDVPGRIVPPSNGHITVQFLGEVEEKTIERLDFILRSLNLGPAFHVHLGALGAFPNDRSARVMWLGIGEGKEGLQQLAKIVREVLAREGFKVDARLYTPHLTLCRFFPSRRMTEWIKKVQLKKLVFPVQEIGLYESILGKRPAIYKRLAEYVLK
jgi:2'-5' RNA ligase